MGQLFDGAWSDGDRRVVDDGSFVRANSQLRDWVRADGSTRFSAEPDRYHLYVNLGCPWAYRTVLYRRLKGLDNTISMSCTRPGVGAEGWTFKGENGPDLDGDSTDEDSHDVDKGLEHLHQVYTRADSSFTGRVTVPVLWDRHSGKIVNNESSEIIRMLNSEFDAFGFAEVDFYPEPLRQKIDHWNERIYATVNNGVYRAGFARSQKAYEDAYEKLFATLDDLEALLAGQRFLAGNTVTEADWRLFATLLRFDLAYYGLFRCNRQRLVDFHNLWAYARDLYQYPEVAETVDFEAIKGIYWSNTGVIPKGPDIDWNEPAGRG